MLSREALFVFEIFIIYISFISSFFSCRLSQQQQQQQQQLIEDKLQRLWRHNVCQHKFEKLDLFMDYYGKKVFMEKLCRKWVPKPSSSEYGR